MEIVVLVVVMRMLVLLLLQVLGLMLVPMVRVAVVIVRSKLMHPITGGMALGGRPLPLLLVACSPFRLKSMACLPFGSRSSRTGLRIMCPKKGAWKKSLQ